MVDISICTKCALGKIQGGPFKGTIWCRKFRDIVNNDSTCDYKDVGAKFELDFGSGFKFYAQSLKRAKALVKKWASIGAEPEAPYRAKRNGGMAKGHGG